jgi:hypothetical protein
MTLKSIGSPPEVTLLACVECGRDIDVCAFCDEAQCGAALCYRCVNRLLYLASDSHQDDG